VGGSLGIGGDGGGVGGGGTTTPSPAVILTSAQFQNCSGRFPDSTFPSVGILTQFGVMPP
jgi:hypothetical protein